MKKKDLKSIRSSFLSRSLSIAKLSAGSGMRMAGHAVGNLFSTPEEKENSLKQLWNDQLGKIAEELGQLKGSFMKVGQMLSMHGEQFFPPEANALLKTLQNASPPLEWPAIEKVLKRQLGAEKLTLIEIEHESIAAASLGQVHRATIKSSGKQIALKIQYPGVDQAIDTDLNLLRTLFSITKILPKQNQFDAVFKVVRQMLHQETDYPKERETTERFRERLKDDPRYIVPQTFAEFSTNRVLATEYIEGYGLDSVEVLSWSQEKRNSLAHALLELYFKELFVWNEVQTDPHFGNYRATSDGKLVLFDFGACRKFPKSFLEPYTRLARYSLLENFEGVVRAAEDLGFLVSKDSDSDRQAFVSLCYLFNEPFPEQGVYDFGDSDLPKRASRGGAKLAFQLKFRSPPREIVFLNRKIGGLFIMMAKLGAKLNLRGELLNFLNSDTTVSLADRNSTNS